MRWRRRLLASAGPTRPKPRGRRDRRRRRPTSRHWTPSAHREQRNCRWCCALQRRRSPTNATARPLPRAPACGPDANASVPNRSAARPTWPRTSTPPARPGNWTGPRPRPGLDRACAQVHARRRGACDRVHEKLSERLWCGLHSDARYEPLALRPSVSEVEQLDRRSPVRQIVEFAAQGVTVVLPEDDRPFRWVHRGEHSVEVDGVGVRHRSFPVGIGFE